MAFESFELPPAKLRRICDPAGFRFKAVAELPELTEIIGQERATRAIEFGIDIPCYGYNIFALGPAGAGKTTTIKAFLDRKALTKPVPDDWCYVNNLRDPYRPRALRLPAGKGVALRDDVDGLVKAITEEIPRAFESEGYEQHRARLTREMTERRNQEFQRLEGYMNERGFSLMRTPGGLLIAPIVEGRPMTGEEYEQLGADEKNRLDAQRPALQEELEKSFRQVRELEREAKTKFQNLDRDIVRLTIGPSFQALKEKYAQYPEVVAYLEEVENDITENVEQFKGSPASGQEESVVQRQFPGFPARSQASPGDRYRVNMVVDNSAAKGAPVIVETNPTYHNLLGRIEHRAEFGTFVTDFSMIKAGALHRANGGYLVVDARAILMNPFSWDGLKRALRHQEIRTEEMGEQYRLIATVSLAPEPIPLDVKVVLIGEPSVYYLLYTLDEEFQKLFKVRADFAVDMDWTPENEEKYARFIQARCKEDKLQDFDLGAVAKIVEYGSQMVEDQDKLTTRFAHVADLVREAAYWARQNGHEVAAAADVQKAIEEKVYRSNQVEERIRELIEEGTIMVDTEGEVVGQVNGLSISFLGDYAFGRPSRITAKTYMGQAGVINIEREAKLSGNIHDKGVLILSGYFGAKYAQDKPLSLSASLCFEQSYSGVEGDSASSTELYALLSALSGLPLQQGIAVTGSVNQQGEVQPVGGVTRKIEGFFEVCKVKGLTGEQGVIVPAKNVKNLMLREDVVKAVEEGRFHIWAVETIDQGISILTGMAAGERQEDGTYPEGTVNYRVNEQLGSLALKMKEFGRPPEKEKEDK